MCVLVFAVQVQVYKVEMWGVYKLVSVEEEGVVADVICMLVVFHQTEEALTANLLLIE